MAVSNTTIQILTADEVLAKVRARETLGRIHYVAGTRDSTAHET
jgi:hypothetical protein